MSYWGRKVRSEIKGGERQACINAAFSRDLSKYEWNFSDFLNHTSLSEGRQRERRNFYIELIFFYIGCSDLLQVCENYNFKVSF